MINLLHLKKETEKQLFIRKKQIIKKDSIKFIEYFFIGPSSFSKKRKFDQKIKTILSWNRISGFWKIYTRIRFLECFENCSNCDYCKLITEFDSNLVRNDYFYCKYYLENVSPFKPKCEDYRNNLKLHYKVKDEEWVLLELPMKEGYLFS